MEIDEHPQRGILALDDEQMNIELLRFIAERNDFRYCGVCTEEEFWKKLEAGTPDLILLDVLLQDKEGFEICRELKQKAGFRDIPVIFLTGKVGVRDKVRGFEAGGVDYVTKPFNEQELIARIRTHISLEQAKRQIEEQARRLKKTNELKDRIFSIIGHDLRSPLSAAKLKMDFIMRGIIDPATEDFREKTVYGLLKTMDEALNLLQNLLGWARSESGQLQAIPEPIELLELVEENFRLIRMAAEHKDIELIHELSADHLAFADLNMVKTVLRNLLSNALKFTPEGGRIRVSTEADSDHRIWIKVSDTGPGITQTDIARILDPGEHFSKLGTQQEPGTGLGLVLCQAFVRINGGEMKIESTPGQGSTFRFSLPRESVQAAIEG